MSHINHHRGETRRRVSKSNNWFSGTVDRRWFKNRCHTRHRARERQALHQVLKGEEVDLFPLPYDTDDWGYYD